MSLIILKYLTFNKVQDHYTQYFLFLFVFIPYVIFKGKFNSHGLDSFGYVIKILFCENYIASK